MFSKAPSIGAGVSDTCTDLAPLRMSKRHTSDLRDRSILNGGFQLSEFGPNRDQGLVDLVHMNVATVQPAVLEAFHKEGSRQHPQRGQNQVKGDYSGLEYPNHIASRRMDRGES